MDNKKEYIMTDKMVELAYDIMEKCKEYHKEYSKVNQKRGTVYIKNEDTGELVVYTRFEQSQKLIDFINGMNNYSI